jgi:hypothetical protein
MKSRFARFANVPEMLRMLHVPADVKTAEDLALPIPALAARDDSQRAAQIITVQPSDELVSYVQNLGERAEAVRGRKVGPDEDNMLKISGDGRRAALDLRLLGQAQDTPGKLAVAATRIAAIWCDHRDHEYFSPSGAAYPVRGALQLVFCDLGTPGPGWNAYDELRDQLTGHGLPPGQIRFIHEAKTDQDKGRLFAACRNGGVAVLVGSTEKMGVGTNVQDRAIALHHLDAPWRPADVAQREGRILRQGNLNPEVQIYRYVTEGSFDGYMWQTLERKARFISQVMHGRLDTREITDIGDTALSFSEVKALATGNPLLLDKAEADAALTRLERAERAHLRNQDALRHAISSHQDAIETLTARSADIDIAIARRQDTRGDAFTMTIGGHQHAKRVDAGQHLKQLVAREVDTLDGSRTRVLHPGQLGGFTLTASIERSLGATKVTLALDGAPGGSIELAATEMRDADPVGLVTRLEQRLARLENRKVGILADIEHAHREITHARASIGHPFPRADQLTAARERVRHIDEQLQRMTAPPPAADQRGEKKPEPPPGNRTSGKAGEQQDDDSPDAAACQRRLRETAHRYLARGLRPVPAWGTQPDGQCCCPHGARCPQPGAHPHTGPSPAGHTWEPLACTTAEEVDQRFADGTEYATGNLMVVIPPGMMAIERHGIDSGRDAAHRLAAELGDLPPTLTHHTPHGATRVYTTPPGWTARPFTSSTPGNSLPRGISLRTPGQLIIAAPSRLPAPSGPVEHVTASGQHIAALPDPHLTAWATPPQRTSPRPSPPPPDRHATGKAPAQGVTTESPGRPDPQAAGDSPQTRPGYRQPGPPGRTPHRSPRQPDASTTATVPAVPAGIHDSCPGQARQPSGEPASGRLSQRQPQAVNAERDRTTPPGIERRDRAGARQGMPKPPARPDAGDPDMPEASRARSLGAERVAPPSTDDWQPSPIRWDSHASTRLTQPASDTDRGTSTAPVDPSPVLNERRSPGLDSQDSRPARPNATRGRHAAPAEPSIPASGNPSHHAPSAQDAINRGARPRWPDRPALRSAHQKDPATASAQPPAPSVRPEPDANSWWTGTDKHSATADWRDQVIATAREPWQPGPIKPFSSDLLRSPEQAPSPEIEPGHLHVPSDAHHRYDGDKQSWRSSEPALTAADQEAYWRCL